MYRAVVISVLGTHWRLFKLGVSLRADSCLEPDGIGYVSYRSTAAARGRRQSRRDNGAARPIILPVSRAVPAIDSGIGVPVRDLRVWAD